MKWETLHFTQNQENYFVGTFLTVAALSYNFLLLALRWRDPRVEYQTLAFDLKQKISPSAEYLESKWLALSTQFRPDPADNGVERTLSLCIAHVFNFVC